MQSNEFNAKDIIKATQLVYEALDLALDQMRINGTQTTNQTVVNVLVSLIGTTMVNLILDAYPNLSPLEAMSHPLIRDMYVHIAGVITGPTMQSSQYMIDKKVQGH